jgi:undecaprenyl pyrophosphate phosphatase UppP
LSIWEAIIYAICGGICELLPMSFSGHAAVLQNAFQLSPLTEGGGYFVRAAIILGVILAIMLALPSEIGSAYMGWRLLRQKRRPRRGDTRAQLQIRTARLYLFALIPMFLSFLFLAYADRISRLPYIAGLLFLNGCFIYMCCRKSSTSEQNSARSGI